MIQFKPITRPIEVDFFTIYEQGGEKFIHIHGYTYESSSEEFVTEDNPDGIYWANMEACGVDLPLSELLSEFEARGEDALDFVNEMYEECQQYQGDYTAEEIVEVINHYYRDIVFSVDYPAKNEGNPDAYLDFVEITMDTPCGEYLTYPMRGDIEL